MPPNKSNTPRSIVYDEIGLRFGRGRKPNHVRKPISAPAGVSNETKRKALEQAKQLIIHRHFAELRSVFTNQVEFYIALDEWAGAKASEQGIKELKSVIEAYYQAHGFVQHEVEPPKISADGAEQVPLLMTSGRPRPRKKQTS